MNTVTKSMRSAAGFCTHGGIKWPAPLAGSLAGMRLAVKDLFALKGFTNSAGNPDWLRTHQPSVATAESLEALLNAGAEFVGFTLTDELAYSLEGNNEHFGSCENPKLPGHSCGGSSMGSAAAVAAGLADIGLGTDTGGSIRVPGCYCGLFGLRPSHGVVSTEGLIGLAPRFDTVGWLTPNVHQLRQTGEVLLKQSGRAESDTLVYDPFLFSLVQPELQSLLQAALQSAGKSFKKIEQVDLQLQTDFAELHDVFRVLQGRAIVEYHRDWIEQVKPKFSAQVQARMDMAFAITDSEVAQAEAVRERFNANLRAQLAGNKTLFLPTSPTTAPKLKEDTTALRPHLLKLTSIAGLSGSAQVHLPLTPFMGDDRISRPYGFSLLQLPGNDSGLLQLVESVTEQWNKAHANNNQ
ncbi:amidase family protein [Reinekea marinisedimentorum]|uniref:Aspartyl-tRNA(Asn)/glutamyl-tRNA(Gln) amidotransferase subunit A n=1 Tax=Reinekea marinisedimentorum TaxID=230495 RepID=A0A4R3HZX6_9GAMM|nr:amidase family protein [Reinekea marinisedimentorum]TCS38966.1 aspartyl-tRNA(Asn)/glutamyl-tRNA(Gln) amidotransferase subunit A [Reinekea marinisedimentorum]